MSAPRSGGLLGPPTARLKFVCPGRSGHALPFRDLYPSVETVPRHAGLATNHGATLVTVTVMDQSGNRIDGAHVTLTTDNCTFVSDGRRNRYISPAAGGKTVTIYV